MAEQDNDSIKNSLAALSLEFKKITPPFSSDISKSEEQRLQDVHDLGLDIASKFLAWVARYFFPAVLLVIIISGFTIEYSDGWGFSYKIPFLIASTAIASSILSVAAVAGVLLKWVFRSK